jgi:hypothetical protein
MISSKSWAPPRQLGDNPPHALDLIAEADAGDDVIVERLLRLRRALSHLLVDGVENFPHLLGPAADVAGDAVDAGDHVDVVIDRIALALFDRVRLDHIHCPLLGLEKGPS